jgi:hypothetical protein
MLNKLHKISGSFCFTSVIYYVEYYTEHIQVILYPLMFHMHNYTLDFDNLMLPNQCY